MTLEELRLTLERSKEQIYNAGQLQLFEKLFSLKSEENKMTLQELVAALEHAREQLYNAELRLDQADPKEPELIDALIYELRAWEKRYEYYNQKLREAVRNGSAIPGRRLLRFAGRG